MQIANVRCFSLEFANVFFANAVFSGIRQCFPPPMFRAIWYVYDIATTSKLIHT